MNTDLKDAATEILENASKAIDGVNDSDLNKFIDAVLYAKRVFVAGAGRSELVLKAFAMRLMHLEIPVYVVGETVTPVIKENDLLVVLSGTGETNSTVVVANVAKKSGAAIALLTSHPESTIGKISDIIVRIEGRTKDDVKSYTARQMDAVAVKQSINPMGTLFETAAVVLLDSVIVCLMRKLEQTEEKMLGRHSKTH